MRKTVEIDSKDVRYSAMMDMAVEATRSENLRIVVRGLENRKDRIPSIQKYGLDFYIAGSTAEAAVFKGHFTEEELATACRNTVRDARIAEIQSAIFGGHLVTVDEWEPAVGEECMYVLTNMTSCNGAGAMFCDALLEKIQTKLDSDFYLLPSSIHEVIIVPDEGGFDRSELDAMVKTINETEVDANDRLADHVFYYSDGKLA